MPDAPLSPKKSNSLFEVAFGLEFYVTGYSPKGLKSNKSLRSFPSGISTYFKLSFIFLSVFYFLLSSIPPTNKSLIELIN